MLTSRGQENLVHARPIAGKSLQPKTPSNFQTPHHNNRAPLGAKTTNAKAQTIQKDQKTSKLQVFKTPAPKQHNAQRERSVNKSAVAQRSDRTKLTVPSTEPAQTKTLIKSLEDDEPDFGYAPPPIVELPDPPMEFGYDETFPQFRPENMFRGYGQIYHSSPKDENGFSIRLKKEEEEHQKFVEQQVKEYEERMRKWPQPVLLSDDEVERPIRKTKESKPDSLRARTAASALSGLKLPSVVTKQTASSKLKINKPLRSRPTTKSVDKETSLGSRPLSVSKNTIGFPKARKAPSILPQHTELQEDSTDETDTLADELSDFEFLPLDLEDGEETFQLPMPE